MPVCHACGQRNPEGAGSCLRCAAPLRSDGPPPQDARKMVTVVFCDVAGSTMLGDRLDPESVRQVMTLFFRAMSEVLERHGGKVEKYIGDAVMAVFGFPILREDDALRAVRAAQEMQEALREVNAETQRRWDIRIQTRIGVNTGEVVVGDVATGHALVVGDTVNVAARLEQAAAPGETLLGAETYALVRDHVTVDAIGPLTLKGKPDPLETYRLVALLPAAEVGARAEPPMIGRVAELATVREAFERSARERRPVTLTVLGSAGVGKTRLAHELTHGLSGDALILHGRCLSYGDGITFWPVAEIVKQACGIADDDARREAERKIEAAVAEAEYGAIVAGRVAALIGVAGEPAALPETFWAVRRFLEHLATHRPVVVVLDDLQWAEPTLLDLVEYLAGWSRAALLMLCLARPDLMEVRPSWGQGPAGATVLALSPLDEEESRRLLAELLGGVAIEEEVTRRITTSAGGNPLFLEEMLRMLEDDGYLRNGDDGWHAVRDLTHIRVPASIHALLASRLDRLSAEELTVIRCASVIGKVFWWGAVAELAPSALAPRVGGHLQALVRKEIIRPEPSTFAGEDAFGFHHILLQESAYLGTPKEQRAELHERFAAWMEGAAGDRLAEFEEVIAYHLEQAVRFLTELGAPADRLAATGARAGAHLAAAGGRALGRRDMPTAVELLSRATGLLPATSREQRDALLALGEARVETGDLSAAEDALSQAERLAQEADDIRVLANAAITRLFLHEYTAATPLVEDPVAATARWIHRLEDLGDDASLARAWRLVGEVQMYRIRCAAADEAFAHAIEHARRAGDTREEAESLGRSIGSGVYGPAPRTEIERRCAEMIEVVARAGGVGGHEAPALRALALVRAMEGRFDEARDLIRRARGIYEEMGLRLRAPWVSETAGAIEILAGDPAAAEAELRRGLDAAIAIGEIGLGSTLAGALAQALVAQGRLDEADRLARESAASAADEDIASQVLWRRARARLLGAAGDAAAAAALAREALSLADGTDDINMQADTLVDLAEVLLVAGASADAVDTLGRAITLYEAKGNVVAAGSARRRLEDPSPSRPA